MKVPFLFSILVCVSQRSLAQSNEFATLYDCAAAVYEDVLSNKKTDFKQDVIVEVAQRATAMGRDNFIVLNKSGARLLSPPPHKSEPDARYYSLIVTPAGESQSIRMSWSVRLNGNDSASWWQVPEKETSNAKVLDVPETKAVLQLALKSKVDFEQRNMESRKSGLNFWIHSRQVKTSQGFGSEEISYINQERFVEEMQKLDKNLGLVRACAFLGDSVIAQTGQRKHAQLTAIKAFLLRGGTDARR